MDANKLLFCSDSPRVRTKESLVSGVCGLFDNSDYVMS